MLALLRRECGAVWSLSSKAADAAPLLLLGLAMVYFAKPFARFLNGLHNRETDAPGVAKLDVLLLIYACAGFVIWGGVMMLAGKAHWKPS